MLRWSFNLQGKQPFNWWRCAIIKNGHLKRKKIRFGPKKMPKKSVFWVFRHNSRKTLRKFDVRLRLSSNLQGGRWIDCKRCDNNKIGLFEGEKLRFEPKKYKILGLLGSSGLHLNASNFHYITPMMLKFTA